MAKAASTLLPAERIEQAILLIRGEKVMLDADLASLYRVTTGQLLGEYPGPGSTAASSDV